MGVSLFSYLAYWDRAPLVIAPTDQTHGQNELGAVEPNIADSIINAPR